MAVKKFSNGQRVLVRAVDNNRGEVIEIPPTTGYVQRLRRADDGAWIALDSRVDVPDAHGFPENDSRSHHVLAYPEDCDEVTT